MQSTPDPQLRTLMQDFYKSLRENDVEKLDQLAQNGLPLSWVQSMSETSLPEYAMKHGSVEAAWWLMANDIMPESWASFSGDAWKSFLKKGWALMMQTEGPHIPMDTYKNIIKVGVRATGEKLPSFLEQSSAQLASQASDLLGRFSRAASALLKTPHPTIEEDVSDNQHLGSSSPKSVTPKEIKARRATPNTTPKASVKKSVKKASRTSQKNKTTKETSMSSAPKPRKP